MRTTMAATLASDVLRDDLAVSVARALASANKRAQEFGIDVSQSLITITQCPEGDDVVWRINYGPQEVVARRGGDLIVEVDFNDASVKRVLHGQ